MTFKQLNKAFDNAITEQEKKALRRERDALYVATCGGERTRAKWNKIAVAKKGIRLLQKLNRLVDRELIISNDERYYNEQTVEKLQREEDALVKEINKTLKPLGVGVSFNTYAYLYPISKGKGYCLHLNYVF